MSTTLSTRVLFSKLLRIGCRRFFASEPQKVNISSANCCLGKMCSPSRSSAIRCYSTTSSIVTWEDVELKLIDTYKEIKTYNSEQVFDLVTHSDRNKLDATHMALCMKRLHNLYCDSEDKGGFVEEINSDARFKRLSTLLLLSARQLTAPVICDTIAFAHHLKCPLPHLYGLLRLATNSVSDMSMDKLAELSNVLMDIIHTYDRETWIAGRLQNDAEWLTLLSNQVELLTKCISLLTESLGHQLNILDMKSKIDLLLAFGVELPFINKLLLSIRYGFEDFDAMPEEIMRLIPALLTCLSSSSSSSPMDVKSWLSSSLSDFKESLTERDERLTDFMLKDIKVDDKYDELMKGFEANIQRQKETLTEEDLMRREMKTGRLLRQLLHMSTVFMDEANRTVTLDQKAMDLLLKSCGAFVRSYSEYNGTLVKKCLEMAMMVSDVVYGDLVSDGDRCPWKKQDLIRILSDLGRIGYFPHSLSDVVLKGRCHGEVDDAGAEVLRSDSAVDGETLLSCIPTLRRDQFLHLLDVATTLSLYSPSSSSSLPLKTLLDHLAGHHEKFLSSKTELDVRMKLASYLLMNGRQVDVAVLENILRDLKAEAKKMKDRRQLDAACLLLYLIRESTLNESLKTSVMKVSDALQKISMPGHDHDDLVMKMWPEAVPYQPSSASMPNMPHGYLITLPSRGDGADDNVSNKRVLLSFHGNECFWRNTNQLKPLWHHLCRCLQQQDYHVVPINIGSFTKMEEEMEAFLKYRVEKSHLFQDLLHIV